MCIVGGLFTVVWLFHFMNTPIFLHCLTVCRLLGCFQFVALWTIVPNCPYSYLLVAVCASLAYVPGAWLLCPVAIIWSPMLVPETSLSWRLRSSQPQHLWKASEVTLRNLSLILWAIGDNKMVLNRDVLICLHFVNFTLGYRSGTHLKQRICWRLHLEEIGQELDKVVVMGARVMDTLKGSLVHWSGWWYAECRSEWGDVL